MNKFPVDSKKGKAICDVCGSNKDLDKGHEDWIPEDPNKSHRHCKECGMVDFFPKKDKLISKVKRQNRFKNWWAKLKS